MRYYYDMHLHSCLSPCGDRDMTPYNLVNMAALNELDIIALTDHNSSKNCPAALEVAKRVGITLICGMELCTDEEIHVVCLFPSLEKAMEFDEYVNSKLLPVKNKPEVFGEQLILNEQDEVVGHEETLLITAANISVENVVSLTEKLGGAAYPAHIDKSSYSILSSLGSIPAECDFKAAEISARGDVASLREKHEILRSVPLILSSDAHYLEDINPRRAWLELSEPSAEAVIEALRGKCRGFGRG